MKSFLLSIVLAAVVSGCTMVDAQKGTLFTMGDSTAFSADWKKGKMTHLEWAANNHTSVTKAHYHGLTNLATEAVLGFAGAPAITGMAAVPAIVNRPTSRATPSPK